MAAISAPTSKSPDCTRTVTLASSDRRKESHFVAVADRRIGRGHVVIYGNAHWFAGRQFALPRISAAAQPGRQAADVLHVAGQLDLLVLPAENLAQPGEIKHLYGGDPGIVGFHGLNYRRLAGSMQPSHYANPTYFSTNPVIPL